VAAEVVVPARRTDEAPRRIGLQPPLVLAPVPDAILRTECPTPAFAVEHREIAHCDAKGARLQIADAALLGEEPVADLCFSEWIDGHVESMA
jgi:hypothetical protein